MATNNDHADYAPSAAERWLRCPASIPLSQSLPEQPGTSPQAEEGTAAHWLFEDYHNRRHRTHAPNGVPLTEELKDKVRISLALVSQHVAKDAVIWREYQCQIWKALELPEPLIWGTADIVALEDDRVWVIDLKYGRWPVSAEANNQLMCYAVGLLDFLGDSYNNFSLAIIQPRRKHGSTWQQWDTNLATLNLWKAKLQDYFDNKNDQHVSPGNWCFFCPYKHHCTTRSQNQLEKMFSIC